MHAPFPRTPSKISHSGLFKIRRMYATHWQDLDANRDGPMKTMTIHANFLAEEMYATTIVVIHLWYKKKKYIYIYVCGLSFCSAWILDLKRTNIEHSALIHTCAGQCHICAAENLHHGSISAASTSASCLHPEQEEEEGHACIYSLATLLVDKDLVTRSCVTMLWAYKLWVEVRHPAWYDAFYLWPDEAFTDIPQHTCWSACMVVRLAFLNFLKAPALEAAQLLLFSICPLHGLCN